MKLTVKIRVNEVAQMLLNEPAIKGMPFKEMAEAVAERYGVSVRQAERYVTRAKEEIARMTKEEARNALDVALRDREFLLQKAKGEFDEEGRQISPPNYYLYLEVAKDRDRLLGLYPQKQREVLSKNVDMEMFTIHGLERLAAGDALEDVMRDKKAVKKG